MVSDNPGRFLIAQFVRPPHSSREQVTVRHRGSEAPRVARHKVRFHTVGMTSTRRNICYPMT